MVCAFVPVLGAISPSILTKVLNKSGYFTVRLTAQVPPVDQPSTAQFAGSSLTPKVSIMNGTTSSVRWSAALPRVPFTHPVSLLNEPTESTKTNTGALPSCFAANSSIVAMAFPARSQSAAVLN